jgi:hypothetical protein
MFSQRRSLQLDANEGLSPSPAVLRARKFFAALIPVILPGRPQTWQNAYQHFRTHAPCALYRMAKSCSN